MTASLSQREREKGRNAITKEQGVPSSTRTALKEWAVACEALGRGEQILVLRKGGISEEHREFRLEYLHFLLFPSYEHQRADLLKPHAQAAFASVLSEAGPVDQVEVRYWADVAEIFDVNESKEVAAVSELHLWSDEYALERLRWRPRKPLQLLALRVHRLARPARIPILAEYGGCKSWLRLAEPVVVEGAQPVLGDQAFSGQLDRVRQALSQGGTRAPQA